MKCWLVISLFILILLTNCENGISVEVVIGETHPWEDFCGRRFWYTLVYQIDGNLEQLVIPINSRGVRLQLPYGKTSIFVAYPLGKGTPLGGAFEGSKEVKLYYAQGPLAEALLNLSKFYHAPLDFLSFEKLSALVLEMRSSGDGFDWNSLAKDVVNDTLSSKSLKMVPLESVTLNDLPVGYWVSEKRCFPSFFSFIDKECVVKELPVGVVRYLNFDLSLELRIIVSPDELPFWHITTPDPLLLISDGSYQELLH
ncbi:MAG: hypothetical protein WC224_00755 [Sphaerochaetaceae bacterium]